MTLVVILNENPDESIHSRVSGNREYTRQELKANLTEGFSGFVDGLVFYRNFEHFRENVAKHLDDFVLNFDFGFKSRMRNMTVPAFCESYKIKYFNPDPYVQVLCQDKFMTEKFAENFGIKTPRSLLVFAQSYDKELLRDFDYPLIIKPNYESESIGITQKSIVSNLDQADSLIKQLLQGFDGIIVEEYIEGKEVAITIFGDQDDLFLEEVEFVFPELDELSYKAYTVELKQSIGVKKEKSRHLSDLERSRLKQLYLNLAPNKLLRVDGRLKNAEFYLIEINANPGLYPKSVVPETFRLYGYSYNQMLEKLFMKFLD